MVNRHIVDFTVVLPTLAEVASARAPSDLDGYSILAELRGRPGRPCEWIYMYHDPLLGVGASSNARASEFAREVRYKLYRVRHCERVDYLFDVATDRRERHPIAPGAGSQEQEATRARLQDIFDQVRPGAHGLPVSCSRR